MPADGAPDSRVALDRADPLGPGLRQRLPLRRGLGLQRPIGKISAKLSSFSAVSAPIFARKYAFCSIFQNLPDSLADFFEIWQNFANFAKMLLIFFNFRKIADFSNRFLPKF